MSDTNPASILTPTIVSASRATDVPKFYSEWLLARLREGFCSWTNPVNRQIYRVSIDALLERIAAIGRALKGHTEKLVFSFADISSYRKVMRNLAGTGCREFTHEEKVEFVSRLRDLNRELGLTLATCAEDIGMYNTCPHLCRYCYANANDESVLANWKRHWLWNAEIHN